MNFQSISASPFLFNPFENEEFIFSPYSYESKSKNKKIVSGTLNDIHGEVIGKATLVAIHRDNDKGYSGTFHLDDGRFFLLETLPNGQIEIQEYVKGAHKPFACSCCNKP